MKKFKYESPVITVEELAKVDVLCESNPETPTPSKTLYSEHVHFDLADFL